MAASTRSTSTDLIPGYAPIDAGAAPRRRLILSIEGLEKEGKCLAVGTLVTLDTGAVVPVEEVTAGMRLLSAADDGTPQVVTVRKAASDGVKPCLRLTLVDGRTVLATRQHRFQTPTGWKTLGALRPRDLVMVPTGIETADSNVIMSRGLPAVLGYLVADGSVGYSNTIFSKNEQAIINDFTESAQALGFTVREYVTKGRRSRAFGLSGKTLKAFRREWNLVHTAAYKTLPDAVMAWPRYAVREFLSRYLTCDGWICAVKGKRQIEVGYCTASEVLARQIAHLLLRFGVSGSLRSKTVSGRTYWSWTGSTGAARIVATQIGFLGADGDKATKLLQAHAQVSPKRLGYQGPPTHPSACWMRVKSVEHVLDLPVYDLDVAPEHAFIANDILTHNTNFALTAPGPIGYMDYDVGMEGVVEKFLRGGHMGLEPRVVYRRTKDGHPHPYRSRFDQNKKAEAEKEWASFETDYYRLLNTARSTIIDTASAMWELKRLASFGKLTQVMPHQYVEANDAFRQIINDAYDGNSNLILLHKRKAEWKEGKDGKGNKTGNFERAGFAEMGFLVQANLVAYRVPPSDYDDSIDGDLGFRLYIRDCRQNPALAGMTLFNEQITFQNLAMMIEPESSPEEWE